MVNRVGGPSGPDFDPSKKPKTDDVKQEQGNKATGPTQKDLPETHGVNANYNQAMIQQFQGGQAVEATEDSVPSNLDDGLDVDGLDTQVKIDRIGEMDVETALAELQNPELKEALLSGNIA